MNYKKEIFILASIVVILIMVRLPGLSLPYHQDEWKNVNSSSDMAKAGTFFAHPPLMQMVFVASYNLLGSDYMRVLPLLFFIASIPVLYLVMRDRFDAKTARWSVFLFVVCFYSVLGSLSPDVDGAILPFLFLLSVYMYDKKRLWLLLPILLAGLLIKLSFILVVGAIVLDYLIGNWKNFNTKKIALFGLSLLGFAVIYAGLICLIKFAYPAFDLNLMFGHANQFAEGLGRNWIQIIVQAIKAIFYLSPLLLAPLLFINGEIVKKTRVFVVYLLLGLVFYFVLFDFSRGALDKYLMFAVVPLAIIVGSIFGTLFQNKKLKTPIIIGIIISVALLLINFLPHSIVPLYPKEEWFGRVLTFKWNILNPFHGGSGPMGFYVSFLFIILSFLSSFVFSVLALFKKEWRASVGAILLMIGFTYNAIFSEELLFGKINGNAPKLLEEASSFIENLPQIKKIITYNDIGAYNLSKMGKYAGRIYATPESEEGYRKKFEEYIKTPGNYFLVVDMPQINPESFYGKFFASCQPVFESQSGKIEAKVYTCGRNGGKSPN